MTSNPKWKRVERHLRDLIPNGKRNPSNGIAQPDVENDHFTFEVKSRDVKNFPAWILKAFDQARLNVALRPGKRAMNLFAVHFGRGNQTRYFVAQEVAPANPDFLAGLHDFMDTVDLIESATTEEV